MSTEHVEPPHHGDDVRVAREPDRAEAEQAPRRLGVGQLRDGAGHRGVRRALGGALIVLDKTGTVTTGRMVLADWAMHRPPEFQAAKAFAGRQGGIRMARDDTATNPEVAAIRDLGYSDEQIAEVVGLVALNVLTGAFDLVAGIHRVDTTRSTA